MNLPTLRAIYMLERPLRREFHFYVSLKQSTFARERERERERGSRVEIEIGGRDILGERSKNKREVKCLDGEEDEKT